ncbi:MAG: LolA family protein [Candidatus Zipacnadales bacterium]
MSGVSLLYATSGDSTPSAMEILQRALDLNEEIRDYTAEVHITTNLAGAPQEIPRFTVYFKRPDKVWFRSYSIIIMPRSAITFGNLAKKIEARVDILLIAGKTVNGAPTSTLKLRPQGGPSRPETIFITADGEKWTVTCLEAFGGTTSHGTFQWHYSLVGGRYWLLRRFTVLCRKWNEHTEGAAVR